MKSTALIASTALLLLFSGSALAKHTAESGWSFCKSNFTTMNPDTKQMETFINFHLAVFDYPEHKMTCHYMNDANVKVSYDVNASKAIGHGWKYQGHGLYNCPAPIKPEVYSGQCKFWN